MIHQETTYLFLCLGVYILAACFQVILCSERLSWCLCVLTKIVSSVILVCLFHAPALSVLVFFAFYPRQKESSFVLWMGVQIVVSEAALLLCLFWMEEKTGWIYVTLALLYLFAAAVDTMIRKLMQRNRQLYRQMEKTAINELQVKCLNERLQLQKQVAERNARLEERENIARNIHNVVGHTITSAIVSLQAYEVLKETKPEHADEKLSAISERMRQALEEIRRVVRVMDADTDEIVIDDFLSLLDAELQKFSMDTEIKIFHNFKEFSELHGGSPLEKPSAEFLHSVLAECLNNGVRHGEATEFVVLLDADAGHIRMSVSDNGTGIENVEEKDRMQRLWNGFGLRKMRDYVQQNAGSIQVETENGFTVKVTLTRACITKETTQENGSAQ